jgi:hypothetical protein
MQGQGAGWNNGNYNAEVPHSGESLDNDEPQGPQFNFDPEDPHSVFQGLAPVAKQGGSNGWGVTPAYDTAQEQDPNDDAQGDVWDGSTGPANLRAALGLPPRAPDDDGEL